MELPQLEIRPDPQFMHLWDGQEYDHENFYGGRNSGKSYHIAEKLAWDAMCIPNAHIVCALQYRCHIDESMHPTIAEAIGRMGLSQYFRIQAKDILCLYSNTKAIFKGLETNPEAAVKGVPRLARSHVDEAQLVPRKGFDVLTDTGARTTIVMPDGSEEYFKAYWSWNNKLPDDPVYAEFIDGATVDPEDPLTCYGKYNSRSKFVSYLYNSFLTSPRAWARINEMYEMDRERYNHIYGGGMEEVSDAVVFRNIHRQEENGPIIMPPEDATILIGVDIGKGGGDPTVAVKAGVWDRNILVMDELRDPNVGYDSLPDFLLSMPDAEKYVMLVDGEPNLIKLLNDNGLPLARAASKPPGSRIGGIWEMRSKRISFPFKFGALWKEFKDARWKVDPRTEKVRRPLDIPDGDDHGRDAIKYLLRHYLRTRDRKFAASEMYYE